MHGSGPSNFRAPKFNISTAGGWSQKLERQLTTPEPTLPTVCYSDGSCIRAWVAQRNLPILLGAEALTWRLEHSLSKRPFEYILASAFNS